MSNLKKILSLVLAITMILSFATSAMAGPFFDVDDDDDYADAINLLASLGVLLGFEDGSYQANGIYTREQFAKILYVLMNGKDDNASMYSGASPFPDVAADRWSAGYITWASNLGIINGREDGLFYPTDIVKYAEAAKMFIVAMGYSSTIYSYPYGFIDKAQTLGMFDDLAGYSTFGDANRGTVAQMAYNCLFAEAPRFGTYTTQEGNSTQTNTYTVIEGAFGVMKASGFYTTVSGVTTWNYYILNGTSAKAYGAPLYDEDQVYINESVFDYSDDVDNMIGEPVQIWYKPPTDKSAFGTDSDLILIERLSSVKTYTVNPLDIDTDRSGNESLYFSDGSATRRLRFSPVTIGANTYYGVQPIGWDGDPAFLVSLEANRPAMHVGYMGYKDFFPDNEAQKSAIYKFIDYTGDGVMDAVYMDLPDFTKVSSVSSTRLSVTTGMLAGSKTLKDDDGNTVINVYEGIAKDDRVLVYPSQAVLSGSVEDVYTVVKAESVLNTKHNSVSGTKLYFDSVRYRVANSDTFKLGDTYDLYLNANGYIADSEKVSSSVGNWILLTDTAQSTNTNGRVTAASMTGYTADGVKRTYLLDLDAIEKNIYLDGLTSDALFDAEGSPALGWDPDNNATGEVYGFGRIFSYTLNSNGAIDSLKHVADIAADPDYDDVTGYVDFGSDVSYDDDKNLFNSNVTGGRGYVTADTIIFNVYEGRKVQVLKVADLPEIKSTGGYTFEDLILDSGDVVAVMINSNSNDKLGSSSDKFGLVISAMEYAGSGSKYYYDLTVAMDGEIKTIRTEELSKQNNLFGYAKLEIKPDGEAKAPVFVEYLSSNGTFNVPTGGVRWTHGAVNSRATSGKALEMMDFQGYRWNDVAEYYEVVLGSGESYLLDSNCAFYLIDDYPYASFNVGTSLTAVENLIDANRVKYTNDLKKINIASSSSMTMSDANNGWMIDMIIEDDNGDETAVAVFIYVNPVRRP